MTTKDRLHQLVDALPDGEFVVATDQSARRDGTR